MEMKKAVEIDGSIVMDMLRDTALWLKGKGSSQWGDVLEGTDKHNLLGAVQRGDVYLFSEGEEIVGMAAVWNTPSEWDQELWQDFGFPENAYYIHRLIVHPNYRGQNYGSRMLTAIKTYFSETADELRLDCISTNPNLLSLYRGNSFVNKGTVEESKGGRFVLFSYPINQ
ncbi:GNAT family N-acetyltransferase [Enterococcus sp. BWM-S5]|uniref:GNAT family N-acetyltransferase n=1 Tax=Enterococcus larvae TaxID=2794352 RepID=A0ABS4CPI2_9ENTE|nr:GNAT family N-acetyltransferase [Enterococcus larvae]MBP1048497.1 GNAT family N-acetyltransferase [Enterococcus larvae]